MTRLAAGGRHRRVAGRGRGCRRRGRGAPRDWLSSLGLDGEDPDAGLAAARAAWEAGDLEHGDGPGRTVTVAPRSGSAAPGDGRDQGACVVGWRGRRTLVAGAAVSGRRRSHAAGDAPAPVARDRSAGAARSVRYTPAQRTSRRRARRAAAPTTKERTDRDPARRTGTPARLMGLQRLRPSHEILSGATADVYFARANSILDREGLDPVVTMEVFCREDAVLCGMGEATNLLGHVLANEPGAIVEAMEDGDLVTPQGGRPPDPGPLPRVRAVRDRDARHALPVHGLGHRRPRSAWRRRRRSP